MAMARVTGEVVSGLALARNEPPGTIMDELAGLMRETERCRERLLRRTVGLPPAGNA